MPNKSKAKKLQGIPHESLSKAAECLKVLAHPVRLQIIEILSRGDVTVQEIAEICSVRPNQACEHLRLMQGHGLLKSERIGRSVHYRIAVAQLLGLLDCLRDYCSTEKGAT